MAWETRDGKGQYYTRSKRVNGRVEREYVGGGLAGELAAAGDAKRRVERERKRQAWGSEKDEIQAAEAAVDCYSRGLERLTTALLVNAGYHRHHRGEWRKRRGR